MEASNRTFENVGMSKVVIFLTIQSEYYDEYIH